MYCFLFKQILDRYYFVFINNLINIFFKKNNNLYCEFMINKLINSFVKIFSQKCNKRCY